MKLNPYKNLEIISPSVKVIIKYDDKILLIHTKNEIYDLPGGRIKYGESNIKALNRELTEELNWQIKEINKLQFFHTWHYVSHSKNIHYVYLVYIYFTDHPLNLKHTEGDNMVWLKIDDIEKLDLIPEFKKMLIKALNKNRRKNENEDKKNSDDSNKNNNLITQ